MPMQIQICTNAIKTIDQKWDIHMYIPFIL